MKSTQFISERPVSMAPADAIIPALNGLGYDDVRRDNNNTVSLYVPARERMAAVRNIVAELAGAKYDANMAGSSIGGILFAGGRIRVRPAGGSGEKSAGLENEQHLIDTINRFVKELGSLTLTFTGDNGRKVTATNVTGAVGAGKDTAGRKKSDVNIMSDGRVLPISIKKSNAEYWESADTLYGQQADRIVDALVDRDEVELKPIGKYTPDGREKVSIKPEVAVKATDEQSLDIVFGSDILAGGGAVVKDTFRDEHYTLKDDHLTVTADLVIAEPADIPENMQVYFLIRNDSSRNRPGSQYPGLRVLGSYASRVKNAKKVDPADLGFDMDSSSGEPESKPDIEVPNVITGKRTQIKPPSAVDRTRSKRTDTKREKR